MKPRFGVPIQPQHMIRISVFVLVLLASVSSATEPRGAVVAVGGGKLPDAIRREFITLAGGAKTAKLVVIPTASELADNAQEHEGYLKAWKDAGVGSVVLLHTRDEKNANEDTFVKPLRDATGIWFSGGDQSKLTKAYLNTKTLALIRERYEAGAVVGGTSAGAAVMSKLMITGGTTEATTAEGFGLLTECVIDQHFSQRKRQQRLAGVLTKNPKLLGVGIDESTAIIVRAGSVRVVGEGAAYFSESNGVKKPIPLRNGDRYDWTKRAKLP
jgi:cyanophycinase